MGYLAKPIPSAGMAFAEEGSKRMANRNSLGRQMRRRQGVVTPPPVKRKAQPSKIVRLAPQPTSNPLVRLGRRIRSIFRQPEAR